MRADLGWAGVQHHRAAGGTDVRTPNIQALLGQSVELDRFYAYKICSAQLLACLQP